MQALLFCSPALVALALVVLALRLSGPRKSSPPPEP